MNANLTQLRITAREIFDETLRAVNAGDPVRRAVSLKASGLHICDAKINLSAQPKVYSIAIGKAAFAMASALDEILSQNLTAGVITGNASGSGTARDRERMNVRRDAGEPQARPPQRGCAGDLGSMPALQRAHSSVSVPSRWRVFHGGHPEPNEQSLAAAQASFDLLERADKEGSLVIFLISGGGSAMIEWPISKDITLRDLRVANRTLVNSGASISEINSVRRTFSAVKGGRLAARGPHCPQVTLIISDVPPGEERNVASGPTLTPAEDAPDAREVIARYHLRSHLPETVLHEIDAPPGPSGPLHSDCGSPRPHFVLLDNRSALEAAAEAARRRGFVTEIAKDISEQSIEEGCSALLAGLKGLCQRADREGTAHKTSNSVCLISGGEFACPVKGDGIGGRNLETALRLAIKHHKQRANSQTAAAERRDAPFVALCAGTDGLDGNSPAAGAIVDDTSVERASAIGLEAEQSLKRSDAYPFFVALGDAITTGPTGTNVRDVRLLLATPGQFAAEPRSTR